MTTRSGVLSIVAHELALACRPDPLAPSEIPRDLSPAQRREALKKFVSGWKAGCAGELSGVSPVDIDIVCSALSDRLENPDAGSLEIALGLRSRGGIQPHLSDFKMVRNGLLLELWHHHTKYSRHTSYGAAKRMAADAALYESDRWPREQYQVTEPSAEPAATFWRILKAGGKTPSLRQVYNILKNETGSAL